MLLLGALLSFTPEDQPPFAYTTQGVNLTSTPAFPLANLSHLDKGIAQDTGIGCPMFPDGIHQYDTIRSTEDTLPYQLRESLRQQVKQVLIWATESTPDSYEGAKCGSPVSAGTAFLYDILPEQKAMVWVTIDHVGKPGRYLTNPHQNIVRLTIEDKAAVRVYADGYRVVLVTPILNDYAKVEIPVQGTPKPGTAEFGDTFSLGRKVWALGRTLVPICGEDCLKTDGILGQQLQEIGSYTECHITNDQSSTVNGPHNYLGADIWASCLPIGGNSGGPLVIKTDDGYRIVGTLNIGANAQSGHIALTNEFVNKTENIVSRIENGWNPQQPQSGSEEVTSSETDAPKWVNWDSLETNERQLWDKVWTNNEPYEWLTDKCPGIAMKTPSALICIKPNEAFENDLDVVDFEGHVQDWGDRPNNWALNSIK